MPGFQPSFLRHLAPIMPDHRRALCPVRRGVITGIRPYARYQTQQQVAALSKERGVSLVFDPEVRLDSDEPGYKHGHFRIAKAEVFQ